MFKAYLFISWQYRRVVRRPHLDPDLGVDLVVVPEVIVLILDDVAQLEARGGRLVGVAVHAAVVVVLVDDALLALLPVLLKDLLALVSGIDLIMIRCIM